MIKNIFIFWHRGICNAPPIVKKCYKSWEKHNPDWNIVELNMYTLPNNLGLGDFVSDIWQRGFQWPHITDFIRILLLQKHGGVWVDATCFCTKPLDDWLPEYIEEGFFAFYRPKKDRMMENWFLYSNKDHLIINRWYDAIHKYYKNNHLPNLYFIHTDIFEKLSIEDEEFKNIWDKVPKYYCNFDGTHSSTGKNDNPLCFSCNEKGFYQPLTDDLKKALDVPVAPLYKLTWKFNLPKLINNTDDKNIFAISYLMGDYNTEVTTVDNYHDSKSCKFYLYEEGKCGISDLLRKNKIWESFMHDIFEKYINKESVVVEGGCHVGVHTLKLAYLSKHVHAFEPMPKSFELLNKNININNLNNITTYNKGLSDNFNKEYFDWIPENNPGGAGLTNNPMGRPEWISSPNKKIEVDVITIDSLNLDKLDFIKLDVEGYESLVINGGLKTIIKFRPVITMEVWSNHHAGVDINYTKKLFKNLLDLGYTCIHIQKPDFLFLP